MRTVIVTDIHANLPALEAVEAHAMGQGADRWVCLGDTVGYAAEPDACCDLIRERAAFCLLGNHDAAAVERMELDYYYEAARQALLWTRDTLSETNRAWLHALPYTVREETVEYCHGSPVNPPAYDYIFLNEHAKALLAHREQLAAVTFLGHAHLPRAWALDATGAHNLPHEGTIALEPGRQYVIAVGSVGQPRDGDARACYGVFDDEARTFTWHRVAYDMDAAAERILGAGLDPHFATRLFLGR